MVLGGGSTPSPLVGLVLIKPNPVPEIPSPPINSLPPLLCPPGRDGMVLAEAGEVGDCGGLAIPALAWEDAVELKLKLGNGGGRDRPILLSLSRPNPFAPSRSSYADIGLRPVALEYEDGAEDALRGGNTNGGLGVGPELLKMGDDCPARRSGEVGECSSSELMVRAFPIIMVGSWLNEIAEHMPCGSEVVTVAICVTAALRRRGGEQLD